MLVFQFLAAHLPELFYNSEHLQVIDRFVFSGRSILSPAHGERCFRGLRSAAAPRSPPADAPRPLAAPPELTSSSSFLIHHNALGVVSTLSSSETCCHLGPSTVTAGQPTGVRKAAGRRGLGDLAEHPVWLWHPFAP